MTKLATSARVSGLAAFVAAEAGIGGAIALGLNSVWNLALLAVGAPFVLLLANVSTATAAFVIAVTQGLEGFQVATPVAAISIGKFAIVAFLLSRIGSRDEPLDVPRLVALHAALLILTAMPQVFWGDLRAILPATMTALAFVVGYVLGRSKRGLSFVARGFASLLISIGVLYLAGLISGLVSSDAPGRSFLDFATPIPRMRYDLILGTLVGWFAPLCGIMGAAYFRNEHGARLRDLLAWCVLVLLGVFVFQTRGFVLGLWASFSFSVMDYRGSPARASLRLAVPMLTVLGLGIVFTQFVDPLSTAIRIESDGIAISAIRANPSILALGAPLGAFEGTLNAAITAFSQPQGAPLHGGWLRFVVEGGLARVALMLSLLVTPIVIARRKTAAQWEPASSFALSTAIAAAVAIGLQLVSDSPSNNAWALWLTLGCVWGLVLSGSDLQQRGPKTSAQTDPPGLGKLRENRSWTGP